MRETTTPAFAGANGAKTRWLIALVALAALVVGAPTIRGGFVGGDDQRLVLNHVLVNHPSFSHAVELFRIVHRDLYQPLPLLSFQLEFAVANTFGLFDESVIGGAWLFHLTNILLHALNAVLVWVVIASLLRGDTGSSRRLIATTVALLFAVHPLQVEVIAWVNGRMMLMSTLFALLSLLTFDRWLRSSHFRWTILTVLFVTLCAISKIRIGLPVLLLMVAIARGSWLTRRMLVLWFVCLIVTAVFVAVNLSATQEAGMFAGASEQLHGSRIVRTILALAWYFRHLVWPTGLASWYPTPAFVGWSDPATLRALLVVLLALCLAVWTIRRWKQTAFGWVWFLATIASTLPLLPARNTLAADRYMYLPIVGLLWIVGIVVPTLAAFVSSRCSRRIATAVCLSGGTFLLAGMVGVSWHTASFYESAIRKSRRIADLFPNTPHVWERAAWAQFDAGEFATAISLAQRELAQEDGGARSMALHVIGQSQFESGEKERGLATLRRAVEIDSRNSKAKYALGKKLDAMGRTEEALSWIETSIHDAPLANPRIIRLASLYRRLGRATDARRRYEKALENNPYEVPATIGLVEMDIETGTRKSLTQARHRLVTLLSWMPENADAWANLGVVENGLGQQKLAIEAYQRALQRNPYHATVALNLAILYQGRGDFGRAGPLLEIAADGGLESFDQIAALHGSFVAQGKPERTRVLWDRFLRQDPDSIEGRLFATWAAVLVGDLTNLTVARERAESDPPHPMALAILAYADLSRDRFAAAQVYIDRLCTALAGQFAGAQAVESRRRLLHALEQFHQQHPDSPWAFCFSARLLLADEQVEAAAMAIELCSRRCKDDACRQCVERTQSRLTPAG